MFNLNSKQGNVDKSKGNTISHQSYQQRLKSLLMPRTDEDVKEYRLESNLSLNCFNIAMLGHTISQGNIHSNINYNTVVNRKP